MTQPSVVETRDERAWPWMMIALGAHTAWGAYPVLARYLQTVSQLPSMSLLAVGNVVALIALLLLLRPRLDPRLFRSRLLWVFTVIILIRSISNLLAARFTLSIYVQLVTLMTPFLVVLLSATLLRDRIPPYTGRAITVASFGALLMMSGEIGKAGIQLALGPEDWLGIGLALGSSLALALYMILVRRGARQSISGEAMFFVQLLSITAVTAPLSFALGEEWRQWRQLGLSDWLVFAAFSLGVLFAANTGQIGALRHLGAPWVSSLLAWRLVSALVIAAMLLEERLTSPWQLLGAFTVLITITWYLWQQRGK